MWPLVIALMGLGAGFLLCKIAPEELPQTKKYLWPVQQGFLALLIATSTYIGGHLLLSNDSPSLYMKDATILINYLRPSVYFLWPQEKFLLFLPLLLATVLWIFNFFRKNIYLQGLHYLFFAYVYFQLENLAFRGVLASLLFLIGLPLGMLWHTRWTNRKKKI